MQCMAGEDVGHDILSNGDEGHNHDRENHPHYLQHQARHSMCVRTNVEMHVAEQQYKSWAQATLTVAVMDPETWFMGAPPPPGTPPPPAPQRLPALQPWYVVACGHFYDLGCKQQDKTQNYDNNVQ